MAKVTITEILGSDSMSASRPIIMSNFKILADEANRIETYLNTSKIGGGLSVATADINGTSNDPSAQIFNCNASGRFVGSLRVGELSVDENLNISAGSLTFSNSTTEETQYHIDDSEAVLPPIMAPKFSIKEFVYTSTNGQIDVSSASFLTVDFGSAVEAGSPGSPSVPEMELVGFSTGQVLVLTFTGSTQGNLKFGNTIYTLSDLEEDSTFTILFKQVSEDGETATIVPLCNYNCAVTKN